MKSTAIVIPNHSGRALLLTHLPSVCRETAVQDVLVVDDASTDGSVEMLRGEFPRVRVVERERNGGFSVAVNDGIRATSSEFVLLLNNDVEVAPGLLDPIMPLFDDESVFAVSPRIILPSRSDLDEGAKNGSWHHGMFYTDQRQNVGEAVPILYATGAAAVYRRSMLESLGGFDEAYSPYYWEDADIGYRAWKRGWKSLYQPAATVYHQHGGTISKQPRSVTDKVKARNALFFIWRNIEDAKLLREHRLWLPAVLAKRALCGDGAFLAGWREAFGRRRQSLEARARDSQFRKLSDRQIFDVVGIEC